MITAPNNYREPLSYCCSLQCLAIALHWLFPSCFIHHGGITVKGLNRTTRHAGISKVPWSGKHRKKKAHKFGDWYTSKAISSCRQFWFILINSFVWKANAKRRENLPFHQQKHRQIKIKQNTKEECLCFWMSKGDNFHFISSRVYFWVRCGALANDFRTAGECKIETIKKEEGRESKTPWRAKLLGRWTWHDRAPVGEMHKMTDFRDIRGISKSSSQWWGYSLDIAANAFKKSKHFYR